LIYFRQKDKATRKVEASRDEASTLFLCSCGYPFFEKRVGAPLFALLPVAE